MRKERGEVGREKNFINDYSEISFSQTHIFQSVFDVIYNELHGHLVLCALGHDNVCPLHGRLYVLMKSLCIQKDRQKHSFFEH